MTTLELLTAKAIAKYPGNRDRILRGAKLVEEGGVTWRGDGTAIVSSNGHAYTVNGHCPCPDVAQGNAPDGCCKHLIAKELFVSMTKEESAIALSKNTDVQSRFMKKFTICEHGYDCKDCCWNWASSFTRGGYGHFSMKKNGASISWRAHRAAWVIKNGPINNGLWVLHTCDNPACVNPAHLWLGTPDDNQKDSMRKGRRPTGDSHGLRLHPESCHRGEGNPRSVLKESDIHTIRMLRSAGYSTQRIADTLQSKRQTVEAVLKGRTWAHIDSRAWTTSDYVASLDEHSGVARYHTEGQWAFYPYDEQGKVIDRCSIVDGLLLDMGQRVMDVEAARGEKIAWRQA